MGRPEDSDDTTRELLARFKAFALPGGEEDPRQISRMRLTETGEMRSSPAARWIPFTAQESIETRKSGFVWEARFRAGRVVPMFVTDAYEDGHGRLIAKVGGTLPVVNGRGPDFDKGELQRYLGGLTWCPPIILSHPTLDCEAAGPLTLRVRDTLDPTGAFVDIDFSDEGCPLRCRADRPRAVGKKTFMTSWSGSVFDFSEREGLRVPGRMEAAWHMPEGIFTYFKCEITSIVMER
jgi:hypothetical protein